MKRKNCTRTQCCLSDFCTRKKKLLCEANAAHTHRNPICFVNFRRRFFSFSTSSYSIFRVCIVSVCIIYYCYLSSTSTFLSLPLLIALHLILPCGLFISYFDAATAAATAVLLSIIFFFFLLFHYVRVYVYGFVNVLF